MRTKSWKSMETPDPPVEVGVYTARLVWDCIQHQPSSKPATCITKGGESIQKAFTSRQTWPKGRVQPKLSATLKPFLSFSGVMVAYSKVYNGKRLLNTTYTKGVFGTGPKNRKNMHLGCSICVGVDELSREFLGDHGLIKKWKIYNQVVKIPSFCGCKNRNWPPRTCFHPIFVLKTNWASPWHSIPVLSRLHTNRDTRSQARPHTTKGLRQPTWWSDRCFHKSLTATVVKGAPVFLGSIASCKKGEHQVKLHVNC